MRGLMQDRPLLLSSIAEFAERSHGDVEIVSRRVEGDVHRHTYREAFARSRRLANALDALALKPGETVVSLAWNGYRHFELYFGVSGSARVLHTVNPRLTIEQVQWILNHAQDRALFFDLTFLPIVQKLHQACPAIGVYVALCSEADLPQESGIPNLLSYEALIGAQSDRYDWPQFDEHAASSLCYTSGTTGKPKGVLYSHRSSVLHAYAVSLPDSLNLSARDTILPVVPMFHVNAWGLAYAAPAMGSKLVLPGQSLDGASLCKLIEDEGVTLAAGVPTVWQGLLDHADAERIRFRTFRRTVIGGASCSRGMYDGFTGRHGIDVLHAWGMTETSPLGTASAPRRSPADMTPDERASVALSQGRAPFGVELRIVDESGAGLPRDGVAAGELQIRGAWVLSAYFGADQAEALTTDGWFATGDIATIDGDGFMRITDRAKDVIKSGGEWISSAELENIALSHPGVLRAACIGVKHPRWDERPIVLVMKRPCASVTREALLSLYADRVAKWQIPDDIVFVDDLPLGATGKLLKHTLRETWRDHLLAVTD
ncbi:long-chain-fatty-acid--CoA ligase [Caballeronia terrestris]|uniref:Long-chain-fatty-acid--CoA ligase n=1 Tax=Caballeronia terrestris TaxID=1226301 RepID=A0A158JMR1_9BURK|nr:3-(methylthio)propionyl-CoA ligase [Caballeronia terrestris]SAL70176.1 long-chain-fatty-acid--CoA ligase [Caballeronia terrestris]